MQNFESLGKGKNNRTGQVMRIPMLLMEGVKKWNFPFPREGRVGEGHFLLNFFLVSNGLKFNFRH